MVSLQKRLASKIFKVGIDKVWLDSSKLEEISKAITRKDIKNLIKKGYIKKLPEKIEFPYKEEKGNKVRKGGKYAIVSRKERWVKTVRALRSYIKELKQEGKIDNSTYRRLYKWIKGGMFRSRGHIRIFLTQRGLLKESGKA